VRSLLVRARDVIRGELRVGLADNCLTNPESRIVEALRAFGRAAPAVELTVEIGEPTGLIQAVQDRRLHCCVNGSVRGDPRFVCDPLFREEFRLYARDAPDLPHVDSLGRHGLSLVARPQEANPLPHALKRLGIPDGVRAKGLEAVATLIGTGAHVGFLPTHYVRSLAGRLPLAEVPGAERLAFTVEFSLVTKADRQAGRPVALMRRLMETAHAGRP
jgi:DNA-binding transcriptional LysR family regulator